MGWRGTYINLDRSVDRRSHILSELERAGVGERFERFPALDGASVARSSRQLGLSNGVWGCLNSHLAVMKRHIGGDDWLHILEDDAVLSRFFKPGLDAVTGDPAWAGFDIVFTNSRIFGGAAMAARLAELFDASTVVDPTGTVTGLSSICAVRLGSFVFVLATSYLVNPASIEKLVALLEAETAENPYPLDLIYSNLAAAGKITAAVTMPYLSIPKFGVSSTIEAVKDPMDAIFWLLDAPYYADRDVEDLSRKISALRERSSATVTSDLLGAAYGAFVASTREPQGG